MTLTYEVPDAAHCSGGGAASRLESGKRWLVDEAWRKGAGGSLPAGDGDAGADHLGDANTDADRSCPERGVGPRNARW